MDEPGTEPIVEDRAMDTSKNVKVIFEDGSIGTHRNRETALADKTVMKVEDKASEQNRAERQQQ